MKINQPATLSGRLCIFAALVILLTGCGGGGTDATSQSVTDRVNQQAAEADREQSEYEWEKGQNDDENENDNEDKNGNQNDEIRTTKVNEDNEDRESTGPIVNTQPVKPPTGPPGAGRLLASQCAQCHGTEGYSTTEIDSLAGESYNELVEEMQEMRFENDNELMHFQARGYSDAQISLIASYFSSLPQSDGGSSDD